MPPSPHPVPRVSWARTASAAHRATGPAGPRLPRRPAIWVVFLLVAGLLGPGFAGPGHAGAALADSSAGGAAAGRATTVAAGATVGRTAPTDAITTRWALPSRAEGVPYRGDQTTRLIGPQPRVDPALGLAAAAVLLAGLLVVTVPRAEAGREWRRFVPGRGPGPRGPPVDGPSGPHRVAEPSIAARPARRPRPPRSAPAEAGPVVLG